MAEQNSGFKNEGNEEGASMQQQQLIALNSVNTSYHLLSTDHITSMGLHMHYLLQSLQQPHGTSNFVTPAYRGAGMLGNLLKGHMISKWQS